MKIMIGKVGSTNPITENQMKQQLDNEVDPRCTLWNLGPQTP